MTTATTIFLALSTFLLGHRLARSRAREERADLERRYQRVLEYVDDYIVANAARWGVHVHRNEQGHITNLLTRCGTPSLMIRTILKERERMRALH